MGTTQIYDEDGAYADKFNAEIIDSSDLKAIVKSLEALVDGWLEDNKATTFDVMCAYRVVLDEIEHIHLGGKWIEAVLRKDFPEYYARKDAERATDDKATTTIN